MKTFIFLILTAIIVVITLLTSCYALGIIAMILLSLGVKK